MRYSIEPKDRIYVKGYRFLSFAKNMGTDVTKVAKNLSNRYSQKLLDIAKNSTADATKTASKKAIQKTAEATGDLIGNEIADKIKSDSKKSSAELHLKKKQKQNNEANDESAVPKKKDTYIQKKDKKLLMN